MMQQKTFTLLLLLASAASLEVPSKESGYEGQLCSSPNNVFHARVDLYMGELGYYVLEECGLDVLNPTIKMELGETYTFVQLDRTNYFHSIGFAYSPYGDEELKIEVEPGTSKGNQDCIKDLTCAAPMYYLNETYLGHYSNNPTLTGNTTRHEEDTGISGYEPLFFRNPHEWTKMGEFSIKFRFDDETIQSDMFYFCHIHEFMGGRIKVTKNGRVLNPLDIPSLGFLYDYQTPKLSDFDKECGTFGLGDFELPNSKCPNRFVCGLDEDPALQSDRFGGSPINADLERYSRCTDAMNCAMLQGMTTGVKARDERALFIHQMIPHHQNAVNMAKALLKAGKTKCDNLANNEDPDCILEAMLYEIVNGQNLQIQVMYNYLDAKRMPEMDNCDVWVETVEEPKKSSASTRGMGTMGFSMAVGLVVAAIMFPALIL